MAESVDVTETRPLRVAGEAGGAINPFVSLVERLVVREAPVVLDRHGLTITDEFAVTQCVNAMRELLVRGARVVLLEAPEHLAAGLAHAGLLLPPSGLSLESRVK
jgi:hypothetical protein